MKIHVPDELSEKIALKATGIYVNENEPVLRFSQTEAKRIMLHMKRIFKNHFYELIKKQRKDSLLYCLTVSLITGYN